MASSFRDPDGCLVTFDNRVLRFVHQSGAANLSAFLASETARKAIDSRTLVSTTLLDQHTAAVTIKRQPDSEAEIVSIVEHDRISFPSFPYEWTPAMLAAAGDLTLDLAESCLDEGLGLKDATPYNILFRDSKPVFVDLLSFEQRNPTDPVWLPYAQFVRTFLLPLLAIKHMGLRMDQIFLTRRDGLEPEEVYRLFSLGKRLRSPLLSLVTLPTWLSFGSKSTNNSVYQRRVVSSEQARFVLSSLFRRLRQQLHKATPGDKKTSHWSGYMKTIEDSFPGYVKEKESFVREALEEFKPRRLLDVGCNDGYFSRLAAQYGAQVVAIDQDPEVVDTLWQQSRIEDLKILPLVIDLTRPTPGVGWRNAEHESFLDRARGSFDAVLMIAVIHHLLVTERIPLGQIFEMASELTSDLLIAEFVPTNDPMFQRLSRGRDHLFHSLTADSFRQACERRFRIIRAQQLGETQRWIYLLRK
ncbi:MAG TPA: methyltransferase domain-containing protein [Pyrinomonadaceae bacterium]|nr:methyltransferase domain-containing protein [Pyrinomonadaceae bacterium]